MDTNGFSDPFAIVYYGDRELFRTKVSRKHSAATTTAYSLSQALSKSGGSRLVRSATPFVPCPAAEQVMTRTLAPQWECSREFSVADVNRVKFTIRIFDLDALGIDDALGDVDLDLKELFAQEEAVNFGRRTTKVSRQSRTFACGPTSLGSYVAKEGKVHVALGSDGCLVGMCVAGEPALVQDPKARAGGREGADRRRPQAGGS